jgi:hypothetical protein
MVPEIDLLVLRRALSRTSIGCLAVLVVEQQWREAMSMSTLIDVLQCRDFDGVRASASQVP